MIPLLAHFQSVLSSNDLPAYDVLFSLLDRNISVNSELHKPYQPDLPVAGQLTPGSLLDFTRQDIPHLPLIVVPDLHARAKFLTDLLDFRLPDEFCSGKNNLTVLTALVENLVRVVCVGDALHSEIHTSARWKKAGDLYQSGNFCNDPMIEEMHDSLNLLQILIEIKIAFPEQFHFLKGNHENILNSEGFGNHPFFKYADEGNMVRDFIHTWYDDALLHLLDCWERSLPLCALFPYCAVSHAEPAREYTRTELLEAKIRSDVAEGLTWTDNGQAQPSSVERTLISLLGRKRAENAVWIGGHRPIQGKFALRQNGAYVQIHNPEKENVALIFMDRPFNPVSDIYSVAGE